MTRLTFKVTDWNFRAGSLDVKATKKSGRRWSARRDRIVWRTRKIKPAVMLAQETDKDSYLSWLTARFGFAGLKRVKAGRRWRHIWFRPMVFKQLDSASFEAKARHNNAPKHMTMAILRHRKTKNKWGFASVHTQAGGGESGRKAREAQAVEFADAFERFCDRHGIAENRRIMGGDWNMVKPAGYLSGWQDTRVVARVVVNGKLASVNKWEKGRLGPDVDALLVSESAAPEILRWRMANTYKASDHNAITLLVVA